MAGIIALAEAAQALVESFGSRLDASIDGGRRQIAEVLRARFSISDLEAARLVQVLEEVRVVRWAAPYSKPHPCVPVVCGSWRFRPR